MSDKTGIQWTDATWNPWHGCKKVSPGCKYCYMYRDKERYGLDPTQVARSKTTFNDPLKWKEPKKVFTCSWSDFFIEEADAWRPEAWDIIQKTPHLTYQILTKRPERIRGNIPASGIPNNVWMGVSIESNDQADRANFLLELDCLTFISFEPLLAAMDWHEAFDGVDWVIIGGESGNKKGKYKFRPCSVHWILDLTYQFKNRYIPVFVKQMGTYIADEYGMKDSHGADMDEWHRAIQVREFPRIYKKEWQKGES